MHDPYNRHIRISRTETSEIQNFYAAEFQNSAFNDGAQR